MKERSLRTRKLIIILLTSRVNTHNLHLIQQANLSSCLKFMTFKFMLSTQTAVSTEDTLTFNVNNMKQIIMVK